VGSRFGFLVVAAAVFVLLLFLEKQRKLFHVLTVFGVQSQNPASIPGKKSMKYLTIKAVVLG